MTFVNNSSTPSFPLSLPQAKIKYGEIVSGVWHQAAIHCELLELPSELHSETWINTATGLPVSHIYCNKDFAPCLLKALTSLKSLGLYEQLKTFDGCFEIRDIRAVPGSTSAHSYAIAIDLNASTNQLGHPGDMSQGFVQSFRNAGLFWGGNFRRTDPMHYTLGW